MRQRFFLGEPVIRIEVVPIENVTTLVKVVRTCGRYLGDNKVSNGLVQERVFDWHEFVHYMFHLKIAQMFVVIR